MPIYEYRRPDGTTFELQQSFTEEPLTVDPESGVPVERVLHPPAVHFKGKGFYNTDYGTRKRQRETAAAEGSSKDGDASSKDSSSKDSASGDRSAAAASESGSSGGSSGGGDRKTGQAAAKDAAGKGQEKTPAKSS
jgi:predicted nucleic acid-binding Zn ribbon protein